MGKKSRKKKRAGRQSSKKKRIQPDDYFQYGPFEMARFGTFNEFRSNMSKEQFEEMQKKSIERFPEVCQEIDNTILQIVQIVQKLPPDEVLKLAFWGMASHHFNKKSEVEIDMEAGLSLRMVDYLQSIIASVKPVEFVQNEIKEEQWQELKKLVDSLFISLNMDYQICRTALARKKEPTLDMDFEEYYYKAQMYWCNVRGHRYSVHEIPFFRDILFPHNDILMELFNIGTEDLLTAMQSIHDSLTFGIGKATEDIREFQKVTTDKLMQKIEGLEDIEPDNLPKIMKQVIEENGWTSWQKDITGRLFGFDLFDIEKITGLPKTLLDELSWEPGQDTGFFEEGDYKGWPLRIWPIFKRPLIKIRDRYYCFALSSLFDNLYRVLQRIIVDKKPAYSSEWSNKQKEVSEQIPFNLFQQLLPNAKSYRSVYYRWHTGQSNIKQWCETDGLLIYEDHIFIIEVKAGAFTYTSPASDFPAYIDSIKNLVFKPAEQGKRFLEYMESADVVELYDSEHIEIDKISKSDFENITICAMTLDSLTELAAQAQHLKKIGVDIGAYPVWPISIDDLRVYTDIFDNPLVFLHFIEQRMLAFRSDLIKTDDELDHMGLYLKHNVYTQYVKNLNIDSIIHWHGYRSDIDSFFAKRITDPNTPCLLKQEMPTRLKEIIDFLSVSNIPGRRKVASLLLDCSGEWRNNIASGIDDVLNQQAITRKPKPLSTYGGIKITLFCWQKELLDRDEKLSLDHTLTSMIVTHDDVRQLIELIYDTNGTLVETHFKSLTLEGIPETELKQLEAKALTLKRQRIDKAKSQRGNIGRNDPCPCGSGKKYKKCSLILFH